MFELEHLTIGYAKRQVITDLSLTIPEQTILAILGPSGSGKTTLLNAIAGLLPHSGEIYLNARPVTRKQATLGIDRRFNALSQSAFWGTKATGGLSAGLCLDT